jgi:hypothetical protein
MDSICCFFRPRVWFCLLLCVLSISAVNASTRVQVSPAATSTNMSPSGVATSKPGLVHVAVQEGEYLPGSSPNRRIPIKVLKGIDYSIPRTINMAKSLFKANLANMLLTATVGAALAAVDYVMSPDQTQLQRKVTEGETVPVLTYGWKFGSSNWCGGQVFSTPSTAQTCLVSAVAASQPPSWKITPGSIKGTSTSKTVYASFQIGTGSVSADSFNNTITLQGTCVAPARIVNDSCVTGSPTYAPVTDSEFGLALDSFSKSQSPEWNKFFVNDVCSGGLNPTTCFKSLEEARSLSGPAMVPGFTTTSTGTFIRPDGNSGSLVTTSITNYNVTYGDTYFDYSKSTKIETKKDGLVTDTKVEDDSPLPAEEEKPDEVASPCGSNCTGPAYVDAYKPTTKTKYNELDSFKSRVSSIPIIAAVSGFFSVSVSGTCPVWSYNGTLGVYAVSMPINLVFDFHCQPWFIALGPWVSAIMLLGCTFIAFRVAVL